MNLLQALIRGKLTGSGGALPALTDPALPSDVASGKEYINGSGAKQTGTLVAYSADDWLDVTKPTGNVTSVTYTGDPDSLLKNRTNVKQINVPNALKIPSFFAQGCINLEGVSAAKATIIQGYAFGGCPNLKKAVFQSASTVESVAFHSSGLEAIELGGNTANGSGFTGTPFMYSFSFKILVLRFEGVYPLAASNGLRNTKFADGNGTLYVPASMISEYQTATNWSRYLASGNQIKSIESTATDPDAPVDLTTHYIDGTLITA